MPTIDVNGFGIGYDRAGDGTALVLVHGAASDARMWQPQLAGLADELTVVAWDEPGAGRSSDLPSEELGLAGVADTLAGLIEAPSSWRPPTSAGFRGAAWSRSSSTAAALSWSGP